MTKIVCGWCGKHIGEKPGPEDLVTHGICKLCADKLIEQLAEEERKRQKGSDK